MDVNHVPELGRLHFGTMITHRNKYEDEDVGGKRLLHYLDDNYVNGDSTLTPTHIREGVVVRADGSHWQAWKYKSFSFKVLEDIIKLDTGVADIEEAQDV
jgi:hypothetical protein